QEFPGVWRKEREGFGSRARRRLNGARRYVGSRIRGRGAIRQKDSVFAGGEELGSFLGSSDGNVECVRAQGTIIELAKFAGAGGETGADGQRPEDAAQPERNLSASGLGLKFGNIRIGSPGEKEEFVEIAKAEEFRFTLR